MHPPTRPTVTVSSASFIAQTGELHVTWKKPLNWKVLQQCTIGPPTTPLTISPKSLVFLKIHNSTDELAQVHGIFLAATTTRLLVSRLYTRLSPPPRPVRAKDAIRADEIVPSDVLDLGYLTDVQDLIVNRTRLPFAPGAPRAGWNEELVWGGRVFREGEGRIERIQMLGEAQRREQDGQRREQDDPRQKKHTRASSDSGLELLPTVSGAEDPVPGETSRLGRKRKNPSDDVADHSKRDAVSVDEEGPSSPKGLQESTATPSAHRGVTVSTSRRGSTSDIRAQSEPLMPEENTSSPIDPDTTTSDSQRTRGRGFAGSFLLGDMDPDSPEKSTRLFTKRPRLARPLSARPGLLPHFQKPPNNPAPTEDDASDVVEVLDWRASAGQPPQPEYKVKRKDLPSQLDGEQSSQPGEEEWIPMPSTPHARHPFNTFLISKILTDHPPSPMLLPNPPPTPSKPPRAPPRRSSLYTIPE